MDIENREYSETRFSTDPYIRQNETREPKNMAIGYMDRGYLPQSADNSPAPEAMVLIDRRTEVFNVMNEIRQNVNIHPLLIVV